MSGINTQGVFTSGFYVRPKRRINVLRGFWGNQPYSFTKNAPIADDQVIKSGQVCFLNEDGEWYVPSDSSELAATKGKVAYIALSDDTDTDVQSSGLLPALSSAGQFEIETAYFEEGETYNPDTPLKVAVGGYLTPADYVTDADTDLVGACSTGFVDLNADFPPKDSQAADGKIVVFKTNYQAARA